MSRFIITALALLLASPVLAQAQRSVLLPVFADVEGAFGTSFVTELRIYNPLDTPAEIEGLTLACTSDCPHEATKVVIPPRTVVHSFVKNGDPARLIGQPIEAILYYSLRVRDLTRQEQSNGVEIPVVTQDDLKHRVQLPGVDLSPRFRSRIRIYGFGERAAWFEIYREDDGSLVYQSPVAFLGAGTAGKYDPPYFEAPLPVMEGTYRVMARADSGSDDYSGPIWAMVTTTNNETQEITVVSPQRAGPYAPPYPWD